MYYNFLIQEEKGTSFFMFGELQNLRNYLNHLIKVNGKSTQKFYLIYLQLILEEFISSIRF